MFNQKAHSRLLVERSLLNSHIELVIIRNHNILDEFTVCMIRKEDKWKMRERERNENVVYNKAKNKLMRISKRAGLSERCKHTI